MKRICAYILILTSCTSSRNLAEQIYEDSLRIMKCECLEQLEYIQVDRRRDLIIISSIFNPDNYYKFRQVGKDLSTEFARGELSAEDAEAIALCFSRMEIRSAAFIPKFGVQLFYKGEEHVWIYVSDPTKLPTKELEWFNENYVFLKPQWYYAQIETYQRVFSPKD